MDRTRSNRKLLKIVQTLQIIFGSIAMIAAVAVIGTIDAIGSSAFYWAWGVFLISLIICLGYSREYELLGGKYE